MTDEGARMIARALVLAAWLFRTQWRDRGVDELDEVLRRIE